MYKTFFGLALILMCCCSAAAQDLVPVYTQYPVVYQQYVNVVSYETHVVPRVTAVPVYPVISPVYVSPAVPIYAPMEYRRYWWGWPNCFVPNYARPTYIRY